MDHAAVLQSVVQWAERDSNVRALVLEGSFARDYAAVDEWSDLVESRRAFAVTVALFRASSERLAVTLELPRFDAEPVIREIERIVRATT